MSNKLGTDVLFYENIKTNELFQKTIATCSMGVLIFDQNLLLIDANEYMYNLFGLKKSNSMGKSFCDVFLCQEVEKLKKCDSCPILKTVKEVLSTGKTAKRADTYHKFKKNGRTDIVWFILNAESITFNDSRFVIVTLSDITKQKYLENNLKDLGITDGHTLLYHRKYITEQLEILATDVGIVKSPLSIIIMDIDDMSVINKNQGTDVGDKIISSLAKIITQTIRHSDFAGRYGGEEYLLLLPDTDKDGAAALTERIMHILAERHFGTMKKPVTFSAGILEINQPDININGFLLNAKILLNRNKEDRKTGWYSAQMSNFD